MAKNELKTQPNDASVGDFLASIEDEQKRKDCLHLVKLMKRITKAQPKMWGPSIVGFGKYHYKYESGREGDWFLAGFSPRKQSLTLYIMSGFSKHDALMKKLGTYKTGKSCLYVKRLADIDEGVLEKLIQASAQYVASRSD